MPDPDDAPSETIGAETTATTPMPDRFDMLLATWTHEMIHDSPVSRSTEAYNHIVNVALPDLWRRLKGII